MSRIDQAYQILRWTSLAQEANYNATELACLCNVSLRQLQRLFQKTLACSPHQFLTEQRIEKAKELLPSGQPHKAIADALAFKDLAHFYHFFKKHMQMTPGEFVREELTRYRQEAPILI